MEVFLDRNFKPISGSYERLPVPEGWIVSNSSTGHMVIVNDHEHTWQFQENPRYPKDK